MAGSTIETDYLIIGAGLAGMAFADSLLTSSDASMVIVDRRDRPGGHWNDAYPFVRLHQPAATYGVNSMPLGSGMKEEIGLNRGLYDLASGQEVLSYFDRVMRHRLLPSGRVRYLPMSEVSGDDGSVVSRLSGATTTISARRIVDSAYSCISVPSTHTPQFEVGAGVRLAPPNDLPRLAPAHRGFAVLGAGKTGMDACIWLLENGVDPDSIRWVMPRDSWLLDRANYQPGEEFVERTAANLADQVQALAEGESADDVFRRLETFGYWRRIDPTVIPTAFHCATVSDGELEAMRRIRHVIRLGRVRRLERQEIVLERGTVPTNPEWMYVDCTAIGIPTLPPRPVFEGNRITLQFVRMCQPAFSAALVAFVETAFEDEAEKNQMCRPIPPSQTPTEWLELMAVELANRYSWSKSPEISEWLDRSRLDGLSSRLKALKGTESATFGHLQRYVKNVVPAVANLKRLRGEV